MRQRVKDSDVQNDGVMECRIGYNRIIVVEELLSVCVKKRL